MGVAAYNRGSAHVAAQIDADQRPVEFELMDRLNAIPKLPDAGRLFGSAQIIEGNGGFWCECPVNGFGFWYKSIEELMRRLRVEIVARVGNAWITQKL